MIPVLHPVTASTVTYSQYCRAVDVIASGRSLEEAGIFSDFFQKLSSPLKKVFTEVKDTIGLGIEELSKAFKSKNVFNLMKAIKFNLALLLKGVREAGHLLNKGLLKVFHELNQSKLMNGLRSGVVKIDEVLTKYPILKKLTGVAIAGFLFWVWLNMTFIGDFDSDFDLSSIGMALAGHYSLEQLLVSDEGVKTLALLASGLLGVSFPWLGSTLANLALALAASGFKYARDNGHFSKLKSLVSMKRV